MTSDATAVARLRSITLFSDLAADELIDLAHVCHRRSIVRDAVVVHQGDLDGDLYGVIEGLLRVSVRAEDGREFALQLLGRGAVFGELALFDGLARSATVSAVHASTVLVIPRRELLPLIMRMPALSLKLLTAMAAHVRRLSTRSEELAVPITARMARKMLEIGDMYGTAVSDNAIALPLHLSQQDLADHIQVTRESVNKCLAGWMREGIVKRTHRQLIVADRARLVAIARGVNAEGRRA